MKTILFLLLALAVSFRCLAQIVQPVTARPKIKVIRNDDLLTLTTRGLEAKNLRRVYGKAFHASKTEQNKYEATVRDTLLVANTGADKLRLFANKYNSFLLNANLTSQRLSFGRSIRIGTSKAVFCKALGLPATFDGYQIMATDDGTNIYFLFRQDKLATVKYEAGSVE